MMVLRRNNLSTYTLATCLDCCCCCCCCSSLLAANNHDEMVKQSWAGRQANDRLKLNVIMSIPLYLGLNLVAATSGAAFVSAPTNSNAVQVFRPRQAKGMKKLLKSASSSSFVCLFALMLAWLL